MTAGWCSRTVRAAVFAAVCVLLAALGHVVMSGRDVPGWALAVGAVATGGAGWCLAGRERGLPLIVSVVVAAQTALHSGFLLAQSVSAGAGPGAGDGGLAGGSASMGMNHMGMSDMGMSHTGFGHMGMGHMGTRHMDMSHRGIGHIGLRHTDATHMDPGTMGAGHMDHAGQMMGGSSSFGMLAAHLLAALLCGLWLAYGERAAFRILRAVAGWLAAPLRLVLALPVPADRPRLRPRRSRSDRAPRLLLLVHAITSRGPPLGAAAA